MNVTPRGFHLGKKAPVESPFGEFKTYFAEAPGAPPVGAHYGSRVNVAWQMDGNGPDPNVTIAPRDWAGCGDCVEACKGHGLTTANYYFAADTTLVPSANAVVEQYCVAEGCTPTQLFNDPNTYDQGEDVATSLTGWCQGVEYGVKLAMTAPVNSSSQKDLMNGIYLGGGLAIGIQLPQSAEDQFPNEWTWVPSSASLGGHCVWLVGYTGVGMDDFVSLITWGSMIRATWQFIKNTIDEAHAVVFSQSIAAGKGPTGLLLPQWEADLNNLNA